MLPESGVFIVADGMGGQAAGEVASEMAVTIIGSALKGVVRKHETDVMEALQTSIVQANAEIFCRALANDEERGMGTTATVMVIDGARYVVGQVGDSRAYLLRDGQLSQITKDHSFVQEQVDAGNLTPEQVGHHPYGAVITRCVGSNAEVVPDVYSGTLHPGDVFLLSSDGLTGMLDEQRILCLMDQHDPPTEVVDMLIEQANQRGGLDNITAIVVRIDDVNGTNEATA
jgi:protein phosphatase